MNAHRNSIGHLAGVFFVIATASWASAQLPDHPILTEVYANPQGAADGPVGRDPANLHQEFFEIWLPPTLDLNINLTIYEIEGDETSNGLGLVNYRLDLPTLCVAPSPAMCGGGLHVPTTPTEGGVVVLGWVDYSVNPAAGTCSVSGGACTPYLDDCPAIPLNECQAPAPTALGGSPSTRVALISGGITTTGGDFVFIAINGHHFGGTTNFPTLLAENLIDIDDGIGHATETSSGLIQNGSSAFLLVSRDAPGYVELCDDLHAGDCVAGADPALPTDASGLSTTALLDGLASNDHSLFDVTLQPYVPGGGIDLETVLPLGGAFSLLIPQIPEEDPNPPNPGIASGYARVLVDVPKTTETAAADDPAADATTAYRHVRDAGPFKPTPGRVVLTLSAPELGIGDDTEKVFQVLGGTTLEVDLLAANVGGNFPIDISATGGTSSNPAVATFGPGTPATNVQGQSFGLPTTNITVPVNAADGASATADANVSATNTNMGDPAVLNPMQTSMMTAIAFNPTTGQDINGLPFETTVFVAIQGIPEDAVTNEFLQTDLGAYVAGNIPAGPVRDLLGHGGILIDPLTDLQNGDLLFGTPGNAGLIESMPNDCCEFINAAGPPAGEDALQTVLNSAEAGSSLTYVDSIPAGTCLVDPQGSPCFPLTPTVPADPGLNAIQVRISPGPAPDMFTFGGSFTPSEPLYFAEPDGQVNLSGSNLNNVTTSRTFELAIVDTNVKPDGFLSTGSGDDFGILVRVEAVEPGSPVQLDQWIFLSFSGGPEGADVDSLNVPPNDSPGTITNVANLIYLDLDNLHDVLGITQLSRVIIIDGDGGGDIDAIEVFNLAPEFYCSDGTQDPDELCDDGDAIDGDGCDSNCTPTGCGNGIVTAGEQCDDGNTDPGDGCDANCMIESVLCGNGSPDPGEDCDEGGIDTVTCDSDCTFVLCGDNHTNLAAGEQCDDGGVVPGDGCDANCNVEFCGDGITNNVTEECDDGNANNNDDCIDNCMNAVCGDGFLHNQQSGTEQCDEGDTIPGDGCDANCQIEVPGCGGPQDCIDGLPCTLDVCNGDGTCSNPIDDTGAVCRAAAGFCDIAEVCDGLNTSCPIDTFDAATECRPSAGQCDPAETCDGTGPDCPADVCEPPMTVCDFVGIGDGICVAGAGGCECTEAGVCVVDTDCDDFNLCTVEFCENGGVCVDKTLLQYGDINNDGFANTDDLNCILDSLSANGPGTLSCCDRTLNPSCNFADILPTADFQKRDIAPCPTQLPALDPNNMGDGFVNTDDLNAILDVLASDPLGNIDPLCTACNNPPPTAGP